MKLLDLFSGIGGFSLGAEYNNIETIGFVEKDAFCQKVLRKHWPNVPILGDIRDVKRDTFESVDIVSGGFPCQPFSVAGKRRGTDDDRYLWDETIRVVSLYKPRWFVGENVEGIVNIQNGMVLRQVQDDLEKEGFEVQCGIIPASGIGAWHQRKRVWIIAHSNSNRESRCSQYVQEGSRELGESHVSHTNNNGLKRGQSETCNKNASGKNDTSFRGESSNNIGRSDDDGGDKKKSRIDETVSRSHDGDQKESTTTKGLCALSEKSDKCYAANQTSANQENNDRTLVQKRQMFQLPKSRGLGDDKTSSERNKIRQGDDNTVSHRVDSNDVSNTHDSRLTNRSQQHQGKSTQEREGQPSSSRQSSVSNTHDSRNRTSRYGSQRERETNAKEGKNRSQFKSSRHSENDVSKSNSNECEFTSTRQSRKNTIWRFYSEEKEQASYDLWSKTSRCDDVSGEQEDVSNSQHQRWSNESIRGHRELGEKSREKEKRGNQSALRSTTCSSERGTDEDVSNSNSLRISAKTRNLSQKDGKIQKDGQSNRRNTKSISRSFERGDSKKENVSNSSSERQLHRESGNLGEEIRETQGARENDTQGTKDTSARGKQDVSHTNKQRAQIQTKGQQSGIQMSGSSKQKSWWQIESSVCTVPDGVSYRLDKDRVNQIKSLGNSIVPQIAYQIFKAIITVDKEE